MNTLMGRLAALWQRPDSSEGQGLAEYALILALIAIVAIIALIFLGGQVQFRQKLIGSFMDRRGVG